MVLRAFSFAIRYQMHFDVRSKADICQLNLPHALNFFSIRSIYLSMKTAGHCLSCSLSLSFLYDFLLLCPQMQGSSTETSVACDLCSFSLMRT